MMNKVPAIALSFWTIKVLATTVGETFADYLNVTLKLGLTITSIIMTVLFVIALVVQLTRRRYIPGIYWLVVVLVSVVGTLVSDTLVDTYGIALQTTSLVFAGTLAIVFAAWYRSEKTLSVHDVRTTRRELFYWSAILATFALGTSAGDLISEASHLGYSLSALLFAGLIAAIAIAYFVFKINGIVAFWIAYILTRPLGASLGDLLSQPVSAGGSVSERRRRARSSSRSSSSSLARSRSAAARSFGPRAPRNPPPARVNPSSAWSDSWVCFERGIKEMM